MSLKPVPPIPFPMVDGRLEKHGLALKRERKGVLISGQRGQLLARVHRGYTYFEIHCGKVYDIIEVLESVYGIEVVDAFDRRYSSKPDNFPSSMSGLPSGRDNIVILGPFAKDPDLAVDWFRVAPLADAAFQRSDIRRKILDETADSVDMADYVDFRACAVRLFNQFLRTDGVLVVNLNTSICQHMIVLMMVAGFLRKVGGHYRTAIPSGNNIDAIENAVADFLSTGAIDAEKYGIVTMNRADARQLEGKLSAEYLRSQVTLTCNRGNVVMLASYRKDVVAE